MKTFLVPTNFSLDSAIVLQYAVQLAKVFRSKIIVYYNTPPNSPIHLVSDIEKQIHAFVSPFDFECYHESEDYVRIETLIQQGNAKENMLRLIKKKEVDILIMESAHHAKWNDIQIDYLLSEVLDKTSVSIITVPSQTNVDSFDHVVYAMALEEGDSDIIDSLLLITDVLDASLTCLHVKAKEEERINPRLEIIQEVYEEKEGHLEFKVISEESVHKGISDFLSENPTQLLVMLTKERSFFEGLFHRSISKRMTFQDEAPTMIVKL